MAAVQEMLSNMNRRRPHELEAALERARYDPLALLSCLDAAIGTVLPELLLTLDNTRAVETGLRLRRWCSQPPIDGDNAAWWSVESGLLAAAEVMIKLERHVQHAALYAAADLVRVHLALRQSCAEPNDPGTPFDWCRLGYLLDTLLSGVLDQCGATAWRHGLALLQAAARPMASRG